MKSDAKSITARRGNRVQHPSLDSQDDEWVMASVAEDNILQLWRMAENIYNDDEDDMLE